MVLHVAQDQTPLGTCTLYRDSKRYQVVEGIHLLVDLIRTYHISLTGWNDSTAKPVRQRTSIVFILMLYCTHELILFGRRSLQHGFTTGEPFDNPRHVSLDHDLQLHLDARVQSAERALHWFATTDLFDQGQECSIGDVVESVYQTTHERDQNDGRTSTVHEKAENFEISLHASLMDFRVIVKVSSDSSCISFSPL